MNTKGFGLLEVLISLVILSVGLLALAALHLYALRANHSAFLRAMAMNQVASISERMRANYSAVKLGAYNHLTPNNKIRPQCTLCSTSEIAEIDAYDWNATNQTLLPSGQGEVIGDGTHFKIIVRWDNHRSGATGTGCSGNNKIDLTCLSMDIEL